MTEEKATQQEIISMAKKIKYYYNLLIAQSESWTEVEEKENAEKRIKKTLNIEY